MVKRQFSINDRRLATSPQKQVIDDTMKHITNQIKPKIVSPDVGSFANKI